MILRNGSFELHIDGDEGFRVKIVQQTSWVLAAFQLSPFPDETIAYSSSHFEVVVHSSSPTRCGTLHSRFQVLQPDERYVCWLSLFSDAVLAYGFPIPERTSGLGLEISAELMAAIIGARHAVTYDQGVVIKGFSSMFIPVKRVPDGGSCGIKWQTRIQTYNTLMRKGSANVLTERDCQRGFGGQLDALLASIKIGYRSEELSTDPRRQRRFQQFGLTQIDVTLGKRDGKCHFQRNTSYRRIVSATKRTVVLLFDTGERRGWLVNATGVLLHNLHHRMPLGVGGVPASSVSLDSAGSIEETLLRNAKLRISLREEEIFVEEVVTDIWSIVELLQAQSIATDALAEDWSPMPPKMTNITKTCGEWPQLVRDVNTLVLLGNGFGEIIRPLGNLKTLCHRMMALPRDKDYLAIPVSVLLELYSLAGACLSKSRLTATNLQLHDCLQILLGQIQVSDLLERDGAVIIGESGSPATSIDESVDSTDYSKSLTVPSFDFCLKKKRVAPEILEIHAKDSLDMALHGPRPRKQARL
ncbi:uncharacterized protein JN550_010166 [Neoarthrinium moseri]|uniref:uncharacterized protein n=1 Tax=Neoarthrinium moseri TaxID=1658444 RepID=UPI001FDAE60B|nr:uncharacterized protein JN550_010166 [Neoarthrinium moseri]KAI1862641.1 hypothetical protein JN550_010166 [Neoarthrinium moseri]